MSEKIWIGNDHGGYDLKVKIVEVLKEKGIGVTDVGCDGERVKYPVFAAKVAKAVQSGEADRGILICSTGIGMSIIANKYKGIRASLCTTAYMGHMTRAHNDSNILCLGAKMTGEWEVMQILEQWLTTEYEGGRHAVSLGLITDAEEEMICCDGFDIKYEEQ
ncbi:MAG: ribose 5-phosphate isomerase B [Eubacteriales bacterium]|nr:ribose 5-phosphate isomerase B [Eubacteriales bacterium]